MKTGQLITIKSSDSLKEMRMEQMAGAQARITQVVTGENNRIRGCWAVVMTPDGQDDEEWYFPTDSIIL